jgi:hypothetical protein
MFIAITAISQPVELEHARTIREHKTQSGALLWWRQMAKGNFDYIYQVMSRLQDPLLMLNMGMHHDQSGPATFTLTDVEQESIAHCVMTLVANVLAREIMFMCWFHMYLPGRFFALTSESPEEVASAQAFCKEAWDDLLAAEKFALDNAKTGEFLKSLLWPHSTWAREILIGLRESGFDKPPADIMAEMMDAAHGCTGSKDVEDLFNYLRRLMKSNLHGHMGRPAQWHACVNSNILEEAGKRQVQLKPCDQVCGRPGVHPSAFRASACEFSLGGDALHTYLGKKTWPSPNPENYSLLPLAHHALHTLAGRLEDLSVLWLSLLLPPMSIIFRGSELLGNTCYWVLASTTHGSLVWHAELHMVGGTSWVKLAAPGAGQPWSMLHVTDPFEWYVVHCKSSSPSRVRTGMEGEDIRLGMAGFALEVIDESPVPCLKYCARTECFQRFTVPQLQQLLTLANVTIVGARPKLEADVVIALVTHLLPDATEEELKKIYALRGKMKQPVIETIITSELAALVEDAVVPEDMEAMEKEVLVKHSAKGVRKKPPAEKKQKDRVPADADVAPLAAPLGPAGPSARPIRAVVGQVFTIAEARE